MSGKDDYDPGTYGPGGYDPESYDPESYGPGTYHPGGYDPDTYDAGSPLTHQRFDGRHPVNVGHLVMGIAFACIVVVWGLVEVSAVAARDLRFLAPLPWLLAGAGGLLALLLRGRRSSARDR